MFALALALSACGGQQVRDEEPRLPQPHAKPLIATLGDSITAGTPAWDPNPEVRLTEAGTGVNPRSQYQFWAARRHPGVRFRNCGVNRERTDQIALRFAQCVTGAQAVVIQGGINDIAQGLPPSVPARNIETMVREAKRLGLRVAIAELLPWNNGYPDADPLIRDLNRQIHAIARRERATVLPFYRTLEDPHAPGRMPRRWTFEGDHPSIAGYRRLAELAFRIP